MAPAKTLYVKDKDVPLWDRFEEAVNQLSAAESVSGLVAQAMRHYLDQFGNRGKGLYVQAPDEGPGDVTFGKGVTAILQPQGAHWVLFLDEDEYGDDLINPYELSATSMDVAGAVEEAQQYRGAFHTTRRAVKSLTFDTIEVEVGTVGESHTERFQGRWLVTPDRDGTRAIASDCDDGSEWDASVYYGVAVTRRGQFAVYWAHCNQDGGMLTVVPTRKEINDLGLPRSIYTAAIAELDDVPMVIERDI